MIKEVLEKEIETKIKELYPMLYRTAMTFYGRECVDVPPLEIVEIKINFGKRVKVGVEEEFFSGLDQAVYRWVETDEKEVELVKISINLDDCYTNGEYSVKTNISEIARQISKNAIQSLLGEME